MFPDARRGIQTRSGGGEAADVIIPFWHVECKIGKRTNIKAAMRQATDDCAAGKAPIAICQDDRQTATVTMLFDDWLALVKEAKIKDKVV